LSCLKGGGQASVFLTKVPKRKGRGKKTIETKGGGGEKKKQDRENRAKQKEENDGIRLEDDHSHEIRKGESSREGKTGSKTWVRKGKKKSENGGDIRPQNHPQPTARVRTSRSEQLRKKDGAPPVETQQFHVRELVTIGAKRGRRGSRKRQ